MGAKVEILENATRIMAKYNSEMPPKWLAELREWGWSRSAACLEKLEKWRPGHVDVLCDFMDFCRDRKSIGEPNAIEWVPDGVLHKAIATWETEHDKSKPPKDGHTRIDATFTCGGNVELHILIADTKRKAWREIRSRYASARQSGGLVDGIGATRRLRNTKGGNHE